MQKGKLFAGQKPKEQPKKQPVAEVSQHEWARRLRPPPRSPLRPADEPTFLTANKLLPIKPSQANNSNQHRSPKLPIIIQSAPAEVQQKHHQGPRKTITTRQRKHPTHPELEPAKQCSSWVIQRPKKINKPKRHGCQFEHWSQKYGLDQAASPRSTNWKREHWRARRCWIKEDPQFSKFASWWYGATELVWFQSARKWCLGGHRPEIRYCGSDLGRAATQEPKNQQITKREEFTHKTSIQPGPRQECFRNKENRQLASPRRYADHSKRKTTNNPNGSIKNEHRSNGPSKTMPSPSAICKQKNINDSDQKWNITWNEFKEK